MDRMDVSCGAGSWVELGAGCWGLGGTGCWVLGGTGSGSRTVGDFGVILRGGLRSESAASVSSEDVRVL
jgi:hypothetical protein